MKKTRKNSPILISETSSYEYLIQTSVYPVIVLTILSLLPIDKLYLFVIVRITFLKIFSTLLCFAVLY
jgi:hypothetical protein